MALTGNLFVDYKILFEVGPEDLLSFLSIGNNWSFWNNRSDFWQSKISQTFNIKTNKEEPTGDYYFKLVKFSGWDFSKIFLSAPVEFFDDVYTILINERYEFNPNLILWDLFRSAQYNKNFILAIENFIGFCDKKRIYFSQDLNFNNLLVMDPIWDCSGKLDYWIPNEADYYYKLAIDFFKKWGTEIPENRFNNYKFYFLNILETKNFDILNNINRESFDRLNMIIHLAEKGVYTDVQILEDIIEGALVSKEMDVSLFKAKFKYLQSLGQNFGEAVDIIGFDERLYDFDITPTERIYLIAYLKDGRDLVRFQKIYERWKTDPTIILYFDNIGEKLDIINWVNQVIKP